MQLINFDDLLAEVGEKELTELSDLNSTFERNDSVIDDANSDAINFISSFIKIPKNPTKLLKDICVDLTIIELKKRQNYPKESYEQILEKCENLLIKMANKKIPTELESENLAPKLNTRAFRHLRVRNNWSKING